ncbi:MAG: NnrU family protein [Candidatus Pelagadaptatus aseana]|uniref:NnrU family protein n=1 Tax=Candidatus Pelagadaptatus aseana TaxID=3120508 RepID=UPI0039B25AE4
MALLICGLLIWSMVHLLPAAGAPLRAALIGRLGLNAYKGLFALLILGSVVLMVLGWRATAPTYLYTLPPLLQSLALALVVVAFILMGAANYPTRIKRVVRHPQLTGLTLWALAHLLLNGDSRSLILFGGLGSWAIVEMIFINRRDGQWLKPEAPSWSKEIIGVVISLIILAAVVWAHPYIAGVPVR